MIKSEPILPIRFYSDVFDQRRFNLHCQGRCTFDLAYPANDLPKFQIRRKSKISTPDVFYLRNVCTDAFNNYYKIIPEASTNFGNTDFYGEFPRKEIIGFDMNDNPIYGTREMIKIYCGKMVSIPLVEPCDTTALTQVIIPLGFNDPIPFQFKIIVDSFFASGAFVIKLKINGVTVAVINSIGTYVFNFDNPDLNDKLVIEFENYKCTDYFSISYMQGAKNQFTAPEGGDVSLDEDLLTVYPMADGNDIIVFCAGNVINVPEGEYYYVVKSGTDYYFSETFQIKSIKEIEKLYRLKWWNDCDINNNILYKSTECDFYNALYLDAGLFKPEYDTREENEENGLGDENVTFQRWQKNLNFEVPASPEFLTDALSGIFLHDNVYVRKPLNFYQEILNNEYEVLKVVPDVENVLEDCFQRVNLKLLLVDRYTDQSCCNDAEIFTCEPCTFNCCEFGECGLGACEYYFSYGNTPGAPPMGVYTCEGDELIEVGPEDIICLSGKYIKLKFEGGVYTIVKTMPNIDGVVPVGLNLNVFASVLPFSFGLFQYNKDGVGWVDLDTVQSDSEGDILYWIPISLTVGATSFVIRINMLTINCDFGYSDEYIII